MSSPLKAVLFDMDGVLFDSMPHHVKAWRQTMELHGISIPVTEVYMNEGRTGSSTIDLTFRREKGRPATEQEKEAIYRQKTHFFNACPEAQPLPGAAELLNLVKRSNLKPILVTGSGQHALLSRLEKFFPGIFTPELMVTAFDVTHGKPHPEPYLMALQKGGIAPHEAVVVENAPLGVESAHRAGIFTVAVNTGPLPDSVLQEAGADLLYPSMFHLYQGWDAFIASLPTLRNAHPHQPSRL